MRHPIYLQVKFGKHHLHFDDDDDRLTKFKDNNLI